MAKKKRPVSGPNIKENLEYKVVPANKKSLEEAVRIAFKGDPREPFAELMSLSPLQFIGAEKGKAYLVENADKWSDRACPYVTIRDIDSLSLPRIKELRVRISSEEKALVDIKNKNDVSGFKARLVTCKSCESKINRNYIKESKCPVCDANLMSTTASGRIHAKEENIRKLKIKLHSECIRCSQQAPLRYLIAVPKNGGKRK